MKFSSPRSIALLLIAGYMLCFNLKVQALHINHQPNRCISGGLKPALLIARKGLFQIYKQNGHYFFTIPDTMLGREMLVVTRLLKSPPNLSVERQQYGGEELNEQIWQWEKHENHIFIKIISHKTLAEKGSNMQEALDNSNLNTILFAFLISSRDNIKHTSTIDVTNFYNGDILATGVSDTIRKVYKITGVDTSRSFIDTIKSFPKNLEVSTTKTYRSASSPTDNSAAAITFKLHTSMLLLPDTLMTPRLADRRIGYIKQEVTDFGNGTEPDKTISFITRWRLEPKDTAAYKRGELVEPKKQIVFYVDPATPKQWVPYFIKSVEQWSKAFEAAGFKNAITARPAPSPEEDPDFSTEDSRYNVIRYFASDAENAYGPSIADPRTGEIIESHVGWYHNQIKQLHDWYFIQTAAANPKARRRTYSTEEMGELICTTITHEIGHTLGLPHNWAGSDAYPTDSLRSKHFTDHHGTAASIMDYARFNYVAQPGDSVTQFNPQIGEYDIWSIKWGYSWFPGNQSKEQERKILDKWTMDRAGNPLFFFGKEMTFYDPRAQNEDLGNNAMLASTYGIENLKKILPNIAQWTYQPGEDESELLDLYKQVLEQYWRYNINVVTNIGGVHINFKTYDQPLAGFEPVDRVQQQNAVKFLNKELFTTPTWLLNKKELSEIDNGLIINKIQSIQYVILARVLSPARLARIMDNQVKQGTKAYGINDLFTDLDNALFTTPSPDIFQRSLQREYIDLLKKLISENNKPLEYTPWIENDKQGYPPINVAATDITPLVKAHLKFISSHLPLGNEMLMQAHRTDLQSRISLILNPKSD